MSRLLIVNADDYGLTPGVSAGILKAHRDGIVTSTSVLAVAPAFEESAPALRNAPEIGIGVHLAAVGEDPPLLPSSRVASLVGDGGGFPSTWKAFLRRAAKVRPSELAAEFAAQIERVRGAGLAVDH
ncbi:MAG TPA: ChbG/HpnK family deacetylase, partial [Thermoanaerobaculia bacterium]